MSLSVNYKIENSTAGTEDKIKGVFEEVRKRVLEFGSEVKERATKYEIRYESRQVFLSMRINAKSIKAWIRVNPKTFKDPKKIVKTMKWGMPHFFYINSVEEIEYAISLIKQAYGCSK